jgi:hypothetical protein
MTYTPIGNPLPVGDEVPLAASVVLAKGGYVMAAPTTGYCSPGSASTSGQIPMGICNPAEQITASSVAGASRAAVDLRPFWGNPASTISNDGFTDADVCTPFYVAGAATPGKLGFSTTKRSLGGLVLGLDTLGTSTPVQWCSPIAYVIAQSAIISAACTFADDSFALTGNTTRAETSIPRDTASPGTVTQVRIAADAGHTAHDSNYWTITVSKRTAAAPGTAVVVATADTKLTGGTGTMTAFKYYDLTLSTVAGATDILPGDVLTVTCTAQTTAAAIARLTVEVIAKVG